MKEIATVCARDCYDTCGLIARVEEGNRIVSIKGDPEHPVTRGFVCPRGAKDPERLSKNRVSTPYARQGNDFESISWENGLNIVSQKLRAVLDIHGPEAVLHLSYAGNGGLLSIEFPRRLWNAIGATQTDYALCSKSGRKGLSLHYGRSYGINPPELLSQNLIIFWGFNAVVSSPHFWALAQKARTSRNAKIIVIDPVHTETARKADLWLQPKPGSDVALTYGIINSMIQHNYVDDAFIKEWTQGVEELKGEAGHWTPEKVEQVTGVDRNLIEQVAEAYGNLKPSATMIGIGLQKRDHGADQVRAISFIPTLLGLHRGFFYSNSEAFCLDDALIRGETLTTRTPKIVPQVAIADLVRRGEFKYIYISCMNPAMTLPNLHAFREGLNRQDVFVVIHETHWTKTASFADIVLPAPTYLEKDDLVIPWTHNVVRFSPKIVDPVTDSRSEIEVMRAMATRLELTEEWLYEDAWNVVEAAMKDALENGDFEDLRAGKMLMLRRKPQNRYATPSGKIEFFSSQAREAGGNPLPDQPSLRREEGRFSLLASATPQFTHTQFQEVYGAIPAIVLVNPWDAERLGIEDGDIVKLSNDLGSMTVKAMISDSVLEGVLWSPRQSEGLEGEPQNGLTSSKPQQIGYGPRFNSTTVSICKDIP